MFRGYQTRDPDAHREPNNKQPLHPFHYEAISSFIGFLEIRCRVVELGNPAQHLCRRSGTFSFLTQTAEMASLHEHRLGRTTPERLLRYAKAASRVGLYPAHWAPGGGSPIYSRRDDTSPSLVHSSNQNGIGALREKAELTSGRCIKISSNAFGWSHSHFDVDPGDPEDFEDPGRRCVRSQAARRRYRSCCLRLDLHQRGMKFSARGSEVAVRRLLRVVQALPRQSRSPFPAATIVTQAR